MLLKRGSRHRVDRFARCILGLGATRLWLGLCLARSRSLALSGLACPGRALYFGGALQIGLGLSRFGAEAEPEAKPSEPLSDVRAIGASVAEVVDVETETPILPPPSKAEES